MKRLVGAVTFLALTFALGWWWSRPHKSCPKDMHISGPITNGKTGEVIGAICQGTAKDG